MPECLMKHGKGVLQESTNVQSCLENTSGFHEASWTSRHMRWALTALRLLYFAVAEDSEDDDSPWHPIAIDQYIASKWFAMNEMEPGKMVSAPTGEIFQFPRRKVESDTVAYLPSQQRDTKIGGPVRPLTWRWMVHQEEACVDSSTVALEVSITPTDGDARFLYTKMQTCPDYHQPFVFEGLPRKALPLPSKLNVHWLLSDPRFVHLEQGKNLRHSVRVIFRNAQVLVHDFLRKAESFFFHFVAESKTLTPTVWRNPPITECNVKSPIAQPRIFHKIPVLIREFAITYNIRSPLQLAVFYDALRGAVNSYSSATGLQFFTSPQLTTNLHPAQVGLLHFGNAPPKHQHVPLFVAEYNAVYLVAGGSVADQVRLPGSSQWRINNLKPSSWAAYFDGTESWNHPVDRLSVTSSTTLSFSVGFPAFLRSFCRKSKEICQVPCLPKGWLAACGKPFRETWHQVSRNSMEAYTSTCDMKSTLMKCPRMRTVCRSVLRLNPRTQFPPERHNASPCTVMEGSAKPTHCINRIRNFLANVTLPDNRLASRIAYNILSGNSEIREIAVTGDFAVRTADLLTEIGTWNMTKIVETKPDLEYPTISLKQVSEACAAACHVADERHAFACASCTYLSALLRAIGIAEVANVTFLPLPFFRTAHEGFSGIARIAMAPGSEHWRAKSAHLAPIFWH